MKKKVLSLAIAAAMAPGFAAAADVSGFADIIYTVTNDATGNASSCVVAAGVDCKNTTEGKFSADGEVDFSAKPADGVTVRVDLDLTLASNTASLGNDSGRIEQAFFAWNPTAPLTVIGGVFNSPIGQEAEDAPDMNFTSHSAIWNALNAQTTLNGNNVAGVALAGAAGPVTITGAVLNHLNQADEENSLALVLNATPIPGLDVELGLATQESNTDPFTPTVAQNVGDVVDLNVQWATPVPGLTVGLDYATFDKLADNAYNVWAKFTPAAMPKLTVGLRFEEFEWAVNSTDNPSGRTGLANSETTDEATTFYIGYQLASNLSVALEVKSGELGNTNAAGDPNGPNAVNGIQEGDLTTLEFIAKY